MFIHILRKEFLLILRDIHALLVLFIMPTVFILIMSLALKNTYSNGIEKEFKVAINSTNSKDIEELNKLIDKSPFFESFLITSSDMVKTIYQDEFDFVVEISSNFKKLIKNNNERFQININMKADIQKQTFEILKNLLVENISKQVMKDFFIQNKINGLVLGELNSRINSISIYKDKKIYSPTSVQQSVPAWLVFSMFFILIPISNTFINERNYGTLNRIKSINVSLFPMLLGKIVPYFIMNQVQVILMLLVGIFVVPLFGGDALEIKGNSFLIFLMSFSISFAAISFALLIANISNTSEEATSIGGVSNIILAALGGIMVPKFVMPLFMQNISDYSPMAWGLNGLLEVLVRGGNIEDISVFMISLILFGITTLFFAYIILIKKESK